MSSTRQTLTFFWQHTRRYPLLVGLGFTNVIQSTINVVVTPLLMGLATAKLANPQATSLSFAQILLLIAGCSAVALVVNRIALTSINRYEVKSTRDISNDIARHIMYETYDFHSKSFSGALISKATKLTNSYGIFVDTVTLDISRNFVIVIFSITILALYSMPLAGIMAVLAFIGLFSTVYMTRRNHNLQKKAVTLISEQTAHLSDMITNAATVKTFAAEEYELGRYNRINQSFASAQFKAWMKQLDANSLRMGTAIIMNLSVLAYGIHGIQHGTLPVAVFVTAQLYAVRITGSFWDMSGIVRNLERVFADAHEMVEIMQTKPNLRDAPNAKKLTAKNSSLNFNDVTFHYNDTSIDDSVIRNFTLHIKPGEKVGLVGRSGGGKTTITKLVLRFMDIQQGSIEVGNQDITQVTQASLRSAIAYVPQEPLLFHRTIAENIGYGQPDAKQGQIEEAAKLAQAHDFIMGLPNQYETKVGERGVKLSGGQRQRIAIARAILKDAPILVLDEATSALDSESELLIQQALWKLMGDRTALVIAHRLSTVQKMDRIIVVEKGQIAEQGKHEDLLKQKGIYAELWAHQSGGFLED